MKRTLITERDVVDAALHGIKVLMIQSNAIITAAAQDEAQKRHIKFSIQTQSATISQAASQKTIPEPSPRITHENTMTIALGSDHGGFSMKEALKIYLAEQGNRVIDVGTDSEQACDYPDFAYAVASLVSSNKAERGIMIDSVGVASAIVANKVPGVRAVPCYDEFVARSSREHNNANVLTLGSKVLGIEMVKTIVKLWLATPFSGGRHLPRVNKISDVEKRFLK
ncbi:MAG: ribose 5-phosphate isomerase B [Ignavibacteriales bacterium]|nr:ribose 5-phosphate isomerase B [Ignavibacteriales bacterium]